MSRRVVLDAVCRSNADLVPDGQGGNYPRDLRLTVLKRPGLGEPSSEGDNQMVDTSTSSPRGDADEYCFCNVSRP